MKTAISPTEDEIFDAFRSSGEALGYAYRGDYNGSEQEGVARMQFTTAEGRRQSTAVAFLHPALKRPNLTAITRAYVQRILFEGKKATKIEYIKNERNILVRADKEVILSGGTYNSAQLLLLSGVGPANQLRENNIEVVANRKNIGANLQDHPSVMIEYERKTRSVFQENLRFDRLFLIMVRAQLF